MEGDRVKTCVYTYLIGSYDGLLPQPVAADSAVDFICFTDDPSLSSDEWEIVLVERRFPSDPVRSARYLKIVGDERLDQYEATLCIDASVLLRQRPEDIVAAWLGDDDAMAIAHHSYRRQTLDEFDEVVRLNYDDRERVHEQLIAYSLFHPAALEGRPLWTGMIARRRTPAVAAAMKLWYEHVLRYSRRDQLSLPAILDQTALPVRVLEVDNFDSEFHQWPVIEGRRIAQGKAKSYSSGPLLAELRRARREVEELHAQLARIGVASVEEVGLTYEDLRAQIVRGYGERDALEKRLGEATRDAGLWQGRWTETQGFSGASANFARSFRSLLRRGR